MNYNLVYYQEENKFLYDEISSNFDYMHILLNKTCLRSCILLTELLTKFSRVNSEKKALHSLQLCTGYGVKEINCKKGKMILTSSKEI